MVLLLKKVELLLKNIIEEVYYTRNNNKTSINDR